MIRHVRESDYEQLNEIQRAAYPPPFNPELWTWNATEWEGIKHIKKYCLVIEDDNGELIGSLIAFRTDRSRIAYLNSWNDITDYGQFLKHTEIYSNTIYLADIAVKPNHHNHEGTRLIEMLKEIAKKCGCMYIIGGARLPESYKCSDINRIEYASRIRSGEMTERNIGFFERNGFTLGRILPNYTEGDHESRDTAIEIIWKRTEFDDTSY